LSKRVFLNISKNLDFELSQKPGTIALLGFFKMPANGGLFFILK